MKFLNDLYQMKKIRTHVHGGTLGDLLRPRYRFNLPMRLHLLF